MLTCIFLKQSMVLRQSSPIMSPSISVVPFAREPKRIALWEIDLSRVCLFRLSVNPFAQLTRLFPHSISISDAFICGTNFTDKNLFANFVLSNFNTL